MASHLHRSILRQLTSVDVPPDDDTDFSQWLMATRHLALVTNNSTEDELIIYASSRNILIHGVIVNRDALEALTTGDLLEWSGNPFVSRAGYAWGGASNDVEIVENRPMWPSLAREHFKQLIFLRTFDGLSDEEATSYEILQEYVHASEVFWRTEQSAYCCFDENGDFDPIISITRKSDSNDITLVTFRREQLEHFLAASNSALVQMFEFVLHRPGDLNGWSDRRAMTVCDGNHFVYRQEVEDGRASITLGVQTVDEIARQERDIRIHQYSDQLKKMRIRELNSSQLTCATSSLRAFRLRSLTQRLATCQAGSAKRSAIRGITVRSSDAIVLHQIQVLPER